MVRIETNDENTPHSPKSACVYRRESIGVTTAGRRNISKLLDDIFMVLSNKEVVFILLMSCFK